MAFREVTDIQLDQTPEAVKAQPSGRFREVKDIQLDKVTETQPNAKKSIGQEITETGEGLGRGFVQGGTLGFADELVGALGAFGARTLRPDLFEGETFSETAQRGIKTQRTKEAEAKEAAPASFLTGEILGAIGTGAAGLKTKAGGKLANFVSKAPSKTSAFLRGGSASVPIGAIQGFGGAEGGFGERVPETIKGGGTAFAAGGTLTAGGKAFAEKFAPKIKRAIAEIPLTLGQSTQNAILQSFEESALKGAKGEVAQEALSGFRELQENAIKRKLSDIKPKSGDEFSLVNDVVSSIKSSRTAMSNKVDAAYESAKLSGEAALDKKLLRNTLGKSIRDIEEKFVLADSPNARKLIKEFRNITKDNKQPSKIIGLEKPATPADITQLEKWRSRVTSAANNTNNRQEAKFLSSIRTQYDSFVDDVLDNALIQGDEQALQAYKNARNLRKDFGKRFESDKIVAKILTNDELTPQNVVNMITGAGSISGKQNTANTINALYKAAGDNKQQVQQQLKSATIDRLFSRSTSSELGSTGEQLLSFAKLDKELNQLLNKNSTLASRVFDKKELESLKGIRQALNVINSKKPGVVNNSNTFEKLSQNIGTFKTIPIMNIVSQSLKDASSAKQAARAIGQIKPIIEQSSGQTKFLLSGAAALPVTTREEAK